MWKTYQKPVCDWMPAIICQHRQVCLIGTLAESEHSARRSPESWWRKSRQAEAASPEELITELADVYEVLDALMSAVGIREEQVRQVQEERPRLLWTEEPA